MPRFHIVTAHRTSNREDDPVIIYCGRDANAAEAARNTALASGEFALADKFIPVNGHTRYSDAFKARKECEAAEAARQQAEALEAGRIAREKAKAEAEVLAAAEKAKLVAAESAAKGAKAKK